MMFTVIFFFLMIRRPPRSTRTDTLFPYTTLFRSSRRRGRCAADPRRAAVRTGGDGAGGARVRHSARIAVGPVQFRIGSDWAGPVAALEPLYAAYPRDDARPADATGRLFAARPGRPWLRPEERRLGKRCVSKLRIAVCPLHLKKKNKE